MEIGAVKQAFNNELIKLKKNLNQTKIQVIHKLTRKAKVFSEKKAPEKLKEKLKRKSESAINEVLIIKKIKIRDLAKFMLTHTGELNSFLNKPKVDTDKACARLLLHKTLNDKYKLIRNRFASVPINDLLMSREERRKMKKEAKEKQKNKKNNATTKSELANVEKGKEFSDDSDISDDEPDVTSGAKKEEYIHSDPEVDDDIDISQTIHYVKKLKSQTTNKINTNGSDLERNAKIYNEDKGRELNYNDSEVSNIDAEELKGSVSENEIPTSDLDQNNDGQSSDSDNDNKINPGVGKFVRLPPVASEPKCSGNINEPRAKIDNKKQLEKSVQTRAKDMNKNKNLNEKLLSRYFKKEKEIVLTDNKVVDPFFITATGENYMSVAEPRQPDEFKEIHRQGNRKLRRAVMFGHAPKVKPRYEEYISNNQIYKPNNYEKSNSDSNNRDRRLNRSDDLKNKSFNKGDRYKKFNDRYDNNNFNNNKKISFDTNPEPKTEKLHPSWEAKKKQSGILPFEGKKIVFDDS